MNNILGWPWEFWVMILTLYYTTPLRWRFYMWIDRKLPL